MMNAIRRIKDESKLITSFQLKADGYCYFDVFLWEDQEALVVNAMAKDKNTIGYVNLITPKEIDSDGMNVDRQDLCIGEIHFIRGRLTVDVLAHELAHVLMHRLRLFKHDTLDIIEHAGGSKEEEMCLEFGKWFRSLYILLGVDD